jgi:hypothetical protein
MTIQTLRNRIVVTAWSLSETGATISYHKTDNPNKPLHLISPPIEVAQGLDSVASIDGYTLAPLTITEDNCTYTWENFSRQYKLSQFEAIMLVTKREMEMETAKMMDILELDESIKALFS